MLCIVVIANFISLLLLQMLNVTHLIHDEFSVGFFVHFLSFSLSIVVVTVVVVVHVSEIIWESYTPFSPCFRITRFTSSEYQLHYID